MLESYNLIELIGMAGAVMLIFFWIIMLPKIIHDLKRTSAECKQDKLVSLRNKAWMSDLQHFAVNQRSNLSDPSLADCWDMFIETIETIKLGYGNWGGVMSMEDIDKLISVIEQNVPYNAAFIGEDLLIFELHPDDVLKVHVTLREEACKASSMLSELQMLRKKMNDKYSFLEYSIENFRKDLKHQCALLSQPVYVSDKGATVYFDDETAMYVPIRIIIPDQKSVSVLARRGAIESLLKEGNDVWVLNSSSKVIEVYRGTSTLEYPVDNLKELLDSCLNRK